MAADPLLGAAHQVDRLKPLGQRHMAALKDGTNLHRERLAASAALVDAKARALALQGSSAVHRSTMRTDRTFRPNPRLYPLVSGSLVMEAGMAENGHGDLRWAA